MANKPTITNLDLSSPFTKTEPKKAGKVNPVSVGLTAEQLARLQTIADELGQTRHAIIKYAIADFIKRYDAGDKPKTKTVTITKKILSY